MRPDPSILKTLRVMNAYKEGKKIFFNTLEKPEKGSHEKNKTQNYDDLFKLVE